MKKLLKLYVRFVQRILITILLTILYITVFSVTRFFMIFIPNKHFHRSSATDSYWISAEGYSSDINTALEQS
jgi:hypothetical protein